MRPILQTSASCLAAFLVLGLSSSAMATGFGANFTYTFADGDVSDFDERIDSETDLYGFGFTLDTNVAADRLINYRLDVNYERSSFKGHFYEGTPPAYLGQATFKGNGGSINNALGFGVLRTRNVRLWLGPTFRIGGSVFSENGAEFAMADVAGGVDLGLNVHTGSLVTIAGTVGYQYAFTYLTSTDFLGSRPDFTGGGHRLRAGITVLFRTRSDQFNP
jgi:hypothetical protein